MSGWQAEFARVVTVLFAVPVFVVWTFAVVDILRRRDLKVVRRAVFAVAVVIAPPAAVLYLLSRPTSIVRHREPTVGDSRDALLDRLEQRRGDPPLMSLRQEQLLLEQVTALCDYGPPHVE